VLAAFSFVLFFVLLRMSTRRAPEAG
jgi:hypothetical protein